MTMLLVDMAQEEYIRLSGQLPHITVWDINFPRAL